MMLFWATFMCRATPVCGGASGCGVGFGPLQNNEQILGYYDGGLGSFGTGPGPALGITFSSGFIAVPPSGIGTGAKDAQLTTAMGTINLDTPYSGFFSFYFGSANSTDQVQLYSGANGSGSLLATSLLGTTLFPFGYAGPAFQSIVFTTTANTLRINAVTFGAFVIPEPGSVLLVAGGLVGLLAWCRRMH
jgi:hypothetical protein